MKESYKKVVENQYVELRGIVSKSEEINVDILRKINQAEKADLANLELNFDSNFDYVFGVEK